MRFDDTRDNTTAIEANLSEADAREETRDVWAGTDIYIDEGEADHIRHSRHIRLVEERHPEHNDGANGYDEDEPEDDGQPSEYEEWQDYMGGDEYYDHSENACW